MSHTIYSKTQPKPFPSGYGGKESDLVNSPSLIFITDANLTSMKITIWLKVPQGLKSDAESCKNIAKRFSIAPCYTYGTKHILKTYRRVYSKLD